MLRAARALLTAVVLVGAPACGGTEQPPAQVDTTRVAVPAPVARPAGDSTQVSLEGPWASEAWRAWRDTATAASLVDTAVADLGAPRAEWPAGATWDFVSEALAARASAGDTTVAPALLAVLADSARADSLTRDESVQRAVSAVFEAHPAHFAVAFAGLSPPARDHAIGALLDGWLHRALGGRAPLDPPSARLAELSPSLEVHALQARLAMREPPYLKALRDALEGRRGVVT